MQLRIAALLIVPALVAGCQRSQTCPCTAGRARPERPACTAATAPGAPAADLEPGDLELAVRLDEQARPGRLEDALTRPLALVLTRRTEQPLRGTLTLHPPRGAELPAAARRFEFDLTDAKEATFETTVSIPAGLGIVQLTYPIELAVAGRTYLTMDLMLTKGPGWRVIGPFPGGSRTDHDTVHPPEEQIDFSATCPGKDGRVLRWRPLPAAALEPNGFFNLNTACEDVDEATAYATADFYAPRAGPARLLLGSDDSVKVWHNGRLVHSNPVVIRGAERAQDTIDLTLAEGRNTFLLKVCDNYGGWGFFFELVDRAGQPLEGLQPTVALARIYPTDPQLTLTAVTRDSATVTWRSDVPAPGRVSVQKALQGRARPHPGPLPRHEMVKPDPDAAPQVAETDAIRMDHTATVRGLEPGTRYLVRAEPGIAGRPTPPLSFYTAPPPGQAQVLRLDLVCVIFPNVAHASCADRPDARQPIEPAELERFRRQLDHTVRFYFVNSGMRLWLNIDCLIDDRFYRIGDDIYGVGLSDLNEDEKLLADVLARHGREFADYDGTVLVSFVKHWEEPPGRWVYPHGGGGTIGIQPVTGLGKCAWRAGRDSNDAWLLCHEFQHQLDSIYHESLQPDHLFCHFQPWDDTAHRHGEHWDGIAWIFREWAGYLTREHQAWPLLEPRLGFRYFTSRWGTVVHVRDADEDGLPDDDPALPLDERRFGSDPGQADTDGDGLSDLLEALACQWTEYGLGYSWAGESATHFCDPRRPDSDGDGLPDGVDPYPVYPVDPRLPRAASASGALTAADFRPFVKLRDQTCAADYALAWNADWLAIRITAPTPPRHLRICLDLDDDGWFVGHDNYDIEIFPRGGGRPADTWHGNADGSLLFGFHNCGVPGRWPFYERAGLRPDEIRLVHGQPDGPYSAEVHIPRNPANGLDLVAGERIGIMLTADPEGGIQRPREFNALSVFEPHTFFAFELVEPQRAARPAGTAGR